MNFRSDMTVELVDRMGGDDSIVKAMLVSTQGVDAKEAEASQGRINFLMKNRHGTPFEHASMTFYMEMPIFVFREFHRHRIGWSYNEMSGRYKELPPTFYVPDRERNLVQVGKPGHYEFVPGDEVQYQDAVLVMRNSYNYAYEAYQLMLERGIAKEVARVVLPVGIYSAQFATCNPRSLMAFLSLRTKAEPYWQEHTEEEYRNNPDDPDGYLWYGHLGETYYTQNPGGSMFPSFPQREIEMVAEKMEAIFAELFPLAYKAFCENGRVAP